MLLSDFDSLRSDKRVKFKEEQVGFHNFTIISYMIADSEFWKKPLALETRGIVFDSETGECVCRPFEKFFNVGENEESSPHLIDYEHAEYYEKRDGSMLLPVKTAPDQVTFKTKKSFYSDVALEAQANAPDNVKALSLYMINLGLTPIFEYTSPNWKIVLDYGSTPKFFLLAARYINSGRYMQFGFLRSFANRFSVPLIQKYDINKEKITWEVANRTQFEGYVLLQPNGVRVKQKTNWYLINHRLMTELRERDVALAVVDEMIDDIKSELTLEGKDLEPILQIESIVIEQFDSIISGTEKLVNLLEAEPTRKDAAIKYSKDKLFPLAIKLFEGKEPRYTQYWKVNFLSSFSLRCVYNKNFSSDEEN
jgi:RNA ligase